MNYYVVCNAKDTWNLWIALRMDDCLGRRFDHCSGESAAEELLIKMRPGLPEIKDRDRERCKYSYTFIDAFLDMEQKREGRARGEMVHTCIL